MIIEQTEPNKYIQQRFALGVWREKTFVKWPHFNSWLSYSESVIKSCVHHDQVNTANSWLLNRIGFGVRERAYTQQQCDAYCHILSYWINKQIDHISSYDQRGGVSSSRELSLHRFTALEGK